MLGPLNMYLLYVNDMHVQEDLECKVRLFADDTLLYRSFTCKNDTMALQCDLDKLGSWTESWQVALPVLKGLQAIFKQVLSSAHDNIPPKEFRYLMIYGGNCM